MSEQYPYLVVDSWCYRFKSEPVMGYFKTKQAANENARLRNEKNALTYTEHANALSRYRVFDATNEEDIQECQ